MMAINSLNWEKKLRSLLHKFLSCKVLFSKTVQTKSVQINSVPATIYHWTSLVSLCVAPCFPTLDTVLEYILSVYLTVTAAVSRETLLFFCRPRPLFSGSVASCTRWQLPYSMFSNFLSMFSCFCAYKLSWLYPLAETVDLHVPKYRKHRWHARSMSEAVFYFAFSAQTCPHCMKTRFFLLFTIEIFWYLFSNLLFCTNTTRAICKPF